MNFYTDFVHGVRDKYHVQCLEKIFGWREDKEIKIKMNFKKGGGRIEKQK